MCDPAMAEIMADFALPLCQNGREAVPRSCLRALISTRQAPTRASMPGLGQLHGVS